MLKLFAFGSVIVFLAGWACDQLITMIARESIYIDQAAVLGSLK